jgi:hypothetical protein
MPNYCQEEQEGWPLIAFQVVEEKVDISSSFCLERKAVIYKNLIWLWLPSVGWTEAS